MEFNFSNLSVRQRQLINDGGWHVGCGRKQPPKRTAEALVKRGVLVAKERQVDVGALRPIRLTEYTVPTEVQAAWLRFVADEGARV